MPFRIALAAFVVLGLTFIRAASTPPLPEGNTGIASRYPLDAGIGSDSSVIFADDFESYSSASGLTSKWNEVFQMSNTRIATEAGNFYSGGKALEFTEQKTTTEVSNEAVKYVNPNLDVLFLRYYTKYDPAMNVVGSSHNGSWISAHYCCPGVAADGYNKFLVSGEAGREDTSIASPGQINAYIYHPEQRDVWGDHFYPTGMIMPFTNIPGDFGPDFVPRPDIVPQTGRWYSFEMMVKANTPGLRDGRVAFWLDGKLIADWMNLRLRDTTALKIDQFTIDYHIKSNGVSASKKWYDNVVAATSYIGPVSSSSTPAPRPPTNVRITP